MSGGAAVRSMRFEGRFAGPTLVSVALPCRDVAITHRGQPLLRGLRQRSDDLDRVDVPRQAREHCGLITRARADLEHSVRLFRRQQLGHQRDDVGLGDALSQTDGQRLIRIGVGPDRCWHKEMPRRRAHRTKNIRIADSPCFDLFADHRVSLLRERLLARAEQDCRDQAGRNEKSWAALNDISPPTHPLRVTWAFETSEPFKPPQLSYSMASSLPFGPATLIKGGESTAPPDLVPDVQR